MKIKYFESSQFINELSHQNINQNLINYSLLIRFFINNADDHLDRELAKQIYNQSKAVPSGALGAAFSDPSFSFWLYLSSCIQKRILNNEEIPIVDVPYLKYFFGIKNKNILRLHLLELNRFVLCAALLSRTNYRNELLVLEDEIFIPIFALNLKVEDGKNIAIVDFQFLDNEFKLFINNKQIDNIENLLLMCEKGGEINYNDNKLGVGIENSLLGSGGKIIIDNSDPYIKSGWSSIYKNPDGSFYKLLLLEETQKCYQNFQIGLNEIKSVWPEMEYNISTIVRTIHIVKSPLENRHMSCTSDQFFGCILISKGDPLIVAEALVHEYSHNILNAIIKSGEIFQDGPPMEEKYYSPWREDARHISGVFHAVFVFVNVSQLLEKLSNKYPENLYLIDRKIENLVRLEFGIEVLKEFEFTKPLAKDLIQELENEIVNLKNSYLKYDLSEYLLTQTKHLKDWIKKYDFNNLPKSLVAV